ncbi:hypothetical protein FNV43_RR17057 [Rhamnella rubrinervis]|uniref:Uncharacterized protein n=1 Tax=Rhamnella rubrinervis TaxID=2594499 RepID=A0A8K0MEA9_9ROSA|nr:hypothetical protein FNV43_RR17057 [Rhamnella rubrinervis]
MIRSLARKVEVTSVPSTIPGVGKGASHGVYQTEVKGSLLKGKAIAGIEKMIVIQDVDEETIANKKVIDVGVGEEDIEDYGLDR